MTDSALKQAEKDSSERARRAVREALGEDEAAQRLYCQVATALALGMQEVIKTGSEKEILKHPRSLHLARKVLTALSLNLGEAESMYRACKREEAAKC